MRSAGADGPPDARYYGEDHSGLGLAIVERLVRRAGGELAISNGESGGLAVRMTFAFDVVARTVSEAAQIW